VILPGFPTSAVCTFHEVVVPLLRRMAGLGLGAEPRETIASQIAARLTSEVGRTEFLLVNLVPGSGGLSASRWTRGRAL
jgi:putative molybdopterin biosynthesis protein